MKYSRYHKVLYRLAKAYGERGACAPIAVSLIARKKLKAVLKVFSEVGRKPGHGSSRKMIREALWKLGWQVVEEWDQREIHEKLISRYPSPHHRLKHATTWHWRRFPEVWNEILGGRKALIFTRRHVSAWTGEELDDWAGNRKKRIESIWIVEPVNGAAGE